MNFLKCVALTFIFSVLVGLAGACIAAGIVQFGANQEICRKEGGTWVWKSWKCQKPIHRQKTILA